MRENEHFFNSIAFIYYYAKEKTDRNEQMHSSSIFFYKPAMAAMSGSMRY